MAKGKKTVLVNASPEKIFWLADGRTLKNLFELSRALEDMDDGTFRHHVNENKNDFSAWAQNVFGETRLARRLVGAQTKEKSQIAVLKHFVSSLTKK